MRRAYVHGDVWRFTGDGSYNSGDVRWAHCGRSHSRYDVKLPNTTEHRLLTVEPELFVQPHRVYDFSGLVFRTRRDRGFGIHNEFFPVGPSEVLGIVTDAGFE